MNDLLLKYSRLNHIAQQQLMDFLDFLLRKPSNKQNDFDLKSYQKKLLQVSVWSEEDIAGIASNASLFNQEIEEW